MPLYEYVCSACTHQFEELVSNGERPPCPRCHASGAKRILSVVSVGRGAEPGPAPGACGTCGDPRGPGACSMN